MRIKSAEFVTTVATVSKIEDTNIPEFAFVGRSNAGKSSLINGLTNRKKLAHTSATPGKTKHINYFNIKNDFTDDFYIVDLPGYGFHKASKAEQKLWQELIEAYLSISLSLKCVFVLMDIRHKPNNLDKQMLTFLRYYNVPAVVVATKADKLSKAQQKNYSTKIANELGFGIKDVLITSSTKKQGMEAVLQKMEQFL